MTVIYQKLRDYNTFSDLVKKALDWVEHTKLTLRYEGILNTFFYYCCRLYNLSRGQNRILIVQHTFYQYIEVTRRMMLIQKRLKTPILVGNRKSFNFPIIREIANSIKKFEGILISPYSPSLMRRFREWVHIVKWEMTQYNRAVRFPDSGINWYDIFKKANKRTQDIMWKEMFKLYLQVLVDYNRTLICKKS